MMIGKFFRMKCLKLMKFNHIALENFFKPTTVVEHIDNN